MGTLVGVSALGRRKAVVEVRSFGPGGTARSIYNENRVRGYGF